MFITLYCFSINLFSNITSFIPYSIFSPVLLFHSYFSSMLIFTFLPHCFLLSLYHLIFLFHLRLNLFILKTSLLSVTFSSSSSSFFFSILFLCLFLGMSSGIAMGKHAGGLAEYRSSEGKAVTLPYRGMIKGTINDILGGIRSSCTYVGAR